MIYVVLLAFAVQTLTPPVVGANSTAMAPPVPRAEAIGSANFELAQPRIHARGNGLRLEGSLCRRPNRRLISPNRVQIDHYSAAGELLDTSYAYAPRLSQREDQRCGRYSATLKSLPQQPAN